VKAVNLIPADSKRGAPGRPSSIPQLPALALFALLAIALAFVTVYVLTSNKISERRSAIATTQTELVQAQAEAAQLNDYTQFAKLAAARVVTIEQIAATRFDWHAALVDLSKVVPSNASLQTLLATISPDASAGASSGSSSGAGSALRGDISAPAIEITGCTKTQDDVARLMSRLRLINGVTRVTLADSAKQAATQTGSSVGESGAAQGCGANAPSFDLVVFFTALPGASATSSAQSASTTTTTTTTTSTTSSATTTSQTATTSSSGGTQ